MARDKRSRPATGVGGDYLEYLERPNGNLGGVFGDVAGHGRTAGLIMAMAKSAVHTQVRIDGRPDQLLPCLGEPADEWYTSTPDPCQGQPHPSSWA